MKVNISPEIATQVRNIVAEVNKYINSGKWELFNSDRDAILSKFTANELMAVGCKIHQLPATSYVELPYTEITEADINKILINVTKYQII